MLKQKLEIVGRKKNPESLGLLVAVYDQIPSDSFPQSHEGMFTLYQKSDSPMKFDDFLCQTNAPL